jgi:REP element-mobilizing transposase RayT
MARRIRRVLPGSVFEVSNRTILGLFLLKPTPLLTEIIIGILARAQALYGMAIHGFVFLSDHYHMLLSPKDAKQLSDFMAYVDGNIAKEACRIHGWKNHVWADRYQAIQVSDEEAAQFSRLKYIFSNSCKEGLVVKPQDWEGATTTHALLEGAEAIEGVWYDRTKEYRARQAGRDEVFPTVETLHLSPLPCWKHLKKEDLQERHLSIVQEVEEETTRMHEDEGTSPMGMDRVLQMHPHDVPKNMKHSKAPMFFAATRKVLQELKEAYRAFLQNYRQAAERLKAGELNVSFPEGCFPPPRPFVEAWTPG